MTVGFAVILTVFMSALFFEISLASEIKNVSDYHFDMSLPAISTLDEAIISFERMNLFVHQYYLKSEIISKDDYLFHKNLVLSLIDDYAHLSSSMDRNGEYFADEAMRSNMFRFSSDMGESFKRFDSTSQEIFSLLDSGSNNMPRIELLLNSLDEEVTTFRYIVSNALIMERNGSTIQQNKLVKLETNELNSFIAFSLIELAVISTIFLIFRHSIKSSIYALTSLTTNLSMGNLKKKIEYKNKDEFIPVANNIRIVQKNYYPHMKN